VDIQKSGELTRGVKLLNSIQFKEALKKRLNSVHCESLVIFDKPLQKTKEEKTKLQWTEEWERYEAVETQSVSSTQRYRVFCLVWFF
jgi:hypothetical protein